MFGIEKELASAAKRTGFLTGGLLLCGVGAAFLTVSVWVALLPQLGMAVTACVLAGAYLGAGLILVGLGNQPQRSATPTQAKGKPAGTEGPPLVQAFMYGLQAGAQADQSRRQARRAES